MFACFEQGNVIVASIHFVFETIFLDVPWDVYRYKPSINNLTKLREKSRNISNERL